MRIIHFIYVWTNWDIIDKIFIDKFISEVPDPVEPSTYLFLQWIFRLRHLLSCSFLCHLPSCLYLCHDLFCCLCLIFSRDYDLFFSLSCLCSCFCCGVSSCLCLCLCLYSSHSQARVPPRC